ncbi:DVU3141 family protein [Roseomonas sp. F4]
MHRTQALAQPKLHHIPGLPAGRAPGRALLAMAALLALAGCGRGGEGVFSNAAVTARPAVVSSDPVVIFASRAQPGATERLTLADGQAAQVRLVRTYYAASGRECRELRVDAGMAERSRLICAAPEGGWVEARPLLRGGGAARP